MKREGKQHGMVRTFHILPTLLHTRPETRMVNPLTSRPTAGLFTKVTSKPTNHSKFTGKCGLARCTECHMHPATKSKAKTKGSSKVRSNEVTYKTLTWQVAGGARPGLKLDGFSATGILDLMSDDYGYDHDYDESDVEEEEEGNRGGVVEGIVKIQSDDEDDVGGKEEDGFLGDDGDEERMSFCDVGMMMMMMMDPVEEYDEEGWCLVEETMT